MALLPDDVSDSSSSPSADMNVISQASHVHITDLSYLADSDSASDDIPSETTDDRVFIVSDTERLSYFSSTSSEASITEICPSCSVRSNVADAVRLRSISMLRLQD